MSVVPYVQPNASFGERSVSWGLYTTTNTLAQVLSLASQMYFTGSTHGVSQGTSWMSFSCYAGDALPGSIVLLGSNFTYGTINGRTVLTGGTVSSVNVSGSTWGVFAAQATFSQLSINASSMFSSTTGTPVIGAVLSNLNYSVPLPPESDQTPVARGGMGHDTFNMGGSNAAIFGGDGFDTASFRYSSGVDVDMSTGIARSGVYTNQLNSIEHVIGGIYGSDTFRGSGGADAFSGLSGDDYVVDAGAGADLLDGGEGHDILSYYHSMGAVVNLAAKTVVDGTTGMQQGSVDQVEGFEEIYGSLTGNDIFAGDSSANTFWGFGGEDFVSADIGTDTYNGGQGYDTISYFYTQGIVANLAAGYIIDGTTGIGSGSIDNVASFEQVYGSDYGRDVFSGDAFANRFWGFRGDDYVIAADGGDDIYDGGEGFDTISYYWSHGATINLGAGTAVDGTTAPQQGYVDTISGFEEVYGSGFYRDVIVGDNIANALWGLGGDDVLVGRGGRDVLNGGGGNDFFGFSVTEDFEAGIWDIVADFGQTADNFDSLYFVGLSRQQLIFGEANGGVYVSTAALGGTGGFFVAGATQADISDQLIFA